MKDITDFEIGQGETFKILLHLFSQASGSIPLDITSCSFSGQLRENYTTDEIATSFTFSKVQPYISGSVFSTLSSEQTMGLTQRSYVYDMVMVDSGSATPNVRRLLEGSFTIRPAVTREF